MSQSSVEPICIRVLLYHEMLVSYSSPSWKRTFLWLSTNLRVGNSFDSCGRHGRNLMNTSQIDHFLWKEIATTSSGRKNLNFRCYILVWNWCCRRSLYILPWEWQYVCVDNKRRARVHLFVEYESQFDLCSSCPWLTDLKKLPFFIFVALRAAGDFG